MDAEESSPPSIPCEICNQLIPYNEYISHLEICQHRTSVLNILNPMLNSFLQNHTASIQFDFGSSNDLDILGGGSNTWRTVNLENLLDSYEMNNIISEVIGNVNHGCIDIDAAISNVIKEDISDSNLRCPVCLEVLVDVDSNIGISKTVCEHFFCKPCITKWLQENRNCPLCNRDFNESESENI